MPDFPARELRPGYVLATGDTVTYVSSYTAGGDLMVKVAAANGRSHVYEHPADVMFFDVDTTFYDQLREGAT